MAHVNSSFCYRHHLFYATVCPCCAKETYAEMQGPAPVAKVSDKVEVSTPRYKEPTPHQKDMLDAIDAMERQAAHLVNEGRTIDNGRRISLATTNLEQGFMWLRKAAMKADKED